jgi:hypothetical protein
MHANEQAAAAGQRSQVRQPTGATDRWECSKGVDGHSRGRTLARPRTGCPPRENPRKVAPRHRVPRGARGPSCLQTCRTSPDSLWLSTEVATRRSVLGWGARYRRAGRSLFRTRPRSQGRSPLSPTAQRPTSSSGTCPTALTREQRCVAATPRPRSAGSMDFPEAASLTGP